MIRWPGPRTRWQRGSVSPPQGVSPLRLADQEQGDDEAAGCHQGDRMVSAERSAAAMHRIRAQSAGQLRLPHHVQGLYQSGGGAEGGRVVPGQASASSPPWTNGSGCARQGGALVIYGTVTPCDRVDPDKDEATAHT